MAVDAIVIGVDPGVTTGISVLTSYDGDDPHMLVQANPVAVPFIVGSLFLMLQDQFPDAVQCLAIEAFRVGRRSGRLAHPAGAATTRRLHDELVAWAEPRRIVVRSRPAADVKTWATDKRLDKLGLRQLGLPHAADAGRHALYAAVHDFGFPDPLSRLRSLPTGEL